MVDECLARGHRVRVYAIRWNAPLPENFAVRIADVRALTNHKLYDRFAQWVQADVSKDPVDLMVGMNKMPGLDVYYAGDSCFEHKARTQRGVLYRLTPRYRAFRAAERAVFDPASPTEILMISDQYTTDFRRIYGTPPQRFHRLPPGIEKDRRAPADAQTRRNLRSMFRQELGHEDADLILLFVGSGFIKKGLDRVLRALQHMDDALAVRTTLYVIGKDNAEPFQRMAARLGVAERVVFFPEGRDDVPSFLWAADGLTLPAYDENAGMIILEAMIAELPVLVTDNCGYAHYVAEAGGGIVLSSPFSQDGYDAALARLLTSEENAAWRDAGRAFACREDIYKLSTHAVDLLERFAGVCD